LKHPTIEEKGIKSMGELKGWVINICTAVFFITAVEMILPDNSMKKYAKFVLGLILITVLINPIVALLNHGGSINTFLNKSIGLTDGQEISVNSSNSYNKVNVDATLTAFGKNIEELTKKSLKEKFKERDFSVKAKVAVNKDKYEVKALEVYVTDLNTNIEKIKRVEINTKSNLVNNKEIESEISEEVKSFLNQELKLAKEAINVYRSK
jgi:stage III sporulation protein AF